jgi:hypothetical protein
MIYLAVSCLLGAAVALIWLALLLLHPTGKHVADSLSGAEWEPVTPAPAPSPVRLSSPRHAPDVRAWDQVIRETYAAIEHEFASRLSGIANWETCVNG